jgi:hypothetical protein
MSEKPNIVLTLSDDFGYGRHGRPIAVAIRRLMTPTGPRQSFGSSREQLLSVLARISLRLVGRVHERWSTIITTAASASGSAARSSLMSPRPLSQGPNGYYPRGAFAFPLFNIACHERQDIQVLSCPLLCII